MLGESIQTINRHCIVVVVLTLIGAQVGAQQIEYKRDSSEFPNPERGVFQYDDDRKGEMEPLHETDLIANRQQNQTVVYRHYTLAGFKKKDLSSKYLRFLNDDAAIARRAGVKMVLRFAYEEEFDKCEPNTKGAGKKRILRHLDQLADYFKQNSDVI